MRLTLHVALTPLCSIALVDGNWAHKITSNMFSFSLQLYTVVQHVKHFNDVVEFGENQEFTDDFEYLATGLKTGQPLNTRCLRCRNHSLLYMLTIIQYLSYDLMFVHYNPCAVLLVWPRGAPCPVSGCTWGLVGKWLRSLKLSVMHLNIQ